MSDTMKASIQRRYELSVVEVMEAVLQYLRARDLPSTDTDKVCITLGVYGAVVEWDEPALTPQKRP